MTSLRLLARPIVLFALTGLAGPLGCASKPTPSAPVVSRASAKATPREHVLPFIEDDYGRAVARAKELHKPIFVDAWAPWCHSCMSMRAFVFEDAQLRPLADRFVWLSIDTEKDVNQAFVTRFENRAWPTLWVIDPSTQTALLRWEGTTTASELTALLGDVSAAAGGGEGASVATIAGFIEGTRAIAASKSPDGKTIDGKMGDPKRAEGIAILERTLAAAAPDHPTRPRIVEALVAAHYETSSTEEARACAKVAAEQAPTMPTGTSRADVIAFGVECLDRVRETEGRLDDAEHRERSVLLATAITMLSAPSGALLADDRSGLFALLVDDAQEAGDTARAREVAGHWAAFLEAQAAAAPDAQARAVFDWHRLLAYQALGQIERALPMLEASARAMPDDFDPPARIAYVDLKEKHWDDGLEEVNLALSKAYGPRKLRVYLTKVELLEGKGSVADVQATVREAIGYGDALPVQSISARRSLEELRRKLQAPATAPAP